MEKIMATTPTQLPVPSEKPQDLKFNSGKIDEFVTSMGWTYTDRSGNKHYTIEGISYLAQQVMNAFGYVTLIGVTFTTGATLNSPNEALFNSADSSYYKWTGSFSSGSKVVPANSTPASTGGVGPGKWLNVGDTVLRSDLNSANDGFGDALLKVKQPLAMAIERSQHDKNFDIINVNDFGAIGNGIFDNANIFKNIAQYIESLTLDSRPLKLIFPGGRNVYFSTEKLWLKRPVYLSGAGATLKYSGSEEAIRIGPGEVISGTFDVFLQGEYTIDGIRITGGSTANHGIYISSYTIEPRIRNVTFEDYGNSTSVDIFSQFECWDIIIDNCRKITYSSTTAVGNFIAISGRKVDGSAYDGGNSRVSILNCWMTSCSNQELGYFAYINCVKGRVIGGGHQHSNGGIILGPLATGTTIDGVYAEISTTQVPSYIGVESYTDGSNNVHFPQHVTITNGYINMHEEKIADSGRMIAPRDNKAKIRNWDVSNMTISQFRPGQHLINQNDLTGQAGNTYRNIRGIGIPASSPVPVQPVVQPVVTLAELWAAQDSAVGIWKPSVGGNATYFKQLGSYVRNGNTVTISFDIGITAIGTGDGYRVGGLPFLSSSGKSVAISVGYYNNLTSGVSCLYGRIDGNSGYIVFTGSTTPAGNLPLQLNVIGNNAQIIGSATYIID